MSAVLNVQTQLKPVSCYQCGTVFGMESGFYDARVRDHGDFYCPNGHRQHFISKTQEERLTELLAKERARSEFLRREAQQQQRSKAAMKGQPTKTKNRIAKGVCPCCNRQFQDLHRHMETKHPDYTKAD